MIHVFGGRACVVNPLLAGPYRRKTDRLDAHTLAYHGMSGLWPVSYFPSTDVIAFLPGKEMLQLLQSVPGVGPVTAAVWLAEVVTPRRFPSPKALTAYIGCDPSLKVSAGKVTERGKGGGGGTSTLALFNRHKCWFLFDGGRAGAGGDLTVRKETLRTSRWKISLQQPRQTALRAVFRSYNARSRRRRRKRASQKAGLWPRVQKEMVSWLQNMPRWPKTESPNARRGGDRRASNPHRGLFVGRPACP